MLRTTRWVAAIIFLYSFPGYAEETFDTHFMIGGMKEKKFPNIISIINNRFQETTNLIFM
ncbi:fimbrial outer membrane usher protein [Escherichia coli]|nr:fimbrial outer membrane usher protein [Escherichia coli]